MVDFAQMSLIEMENFIIDAKTVEPLYRIDVFLERRLTTLFQKLEKSRNTEQHSEMKGEISWTKNMWDICKKKQDDVRSNNDRFNSRFREKAKQVLTTQVYNEIAEYAKRYSV